MVRFDGPIRWFDSMVRFDVRCLHPSSSDPRSISAPARIPKGEPSRDFTRSKTDNRISALGNHQRTHPVHKGLCPKTKQTAPILRCPPLGTTVLFLPLEHQAPRDTPAEAKIVNAPSPRSPMKPTEKINCTNAHLLVALLGTLDLFPGEEIFEVKWMGELETKWETKQTLSKWPEKLDKFLRIEQLKANSKNYHLPVDIPQWEITYKWKPFTHEPIDTPFQRICVPLIRQIIEKNRKMLSSSRREYQHLHPQMYEAFCLERIKTPKEQKEQEGRIESVKFVEDKVFWENLKMF
ncbi:12888_t:CDS:2 [Ambispora leptoticha]|uniref:12888_t:CDS:1 n=1 Tax=Ambispora leptoticha TaxID=144679 RepID=A0A9N8W5E2_9GLOM|nr:12888_t:CDS:2 [Ambispora leptoticha]